MPWRREYSSREATARQRIRRTLLKTYLRYTFNDSAHGYLDTSAAIRESILLQVTSCEGNIEKFLHLNINSDDWENISETFAEFHENVGDYSNALALQSEVVRRRKIKLSPDNPDLISSQCLLGQIYNSLGQFEEAEYQLRKVQLQKRASSKQDISVLKAADNLIWALVCQGKYAEAKGNLEQQTRALRSLYGEDSRPLLRSFRMLGWVLANDDNLGDAESLIANTTAKCEEFFGENDLDTLTCYNAQGVLYRMEGVVSKAEELIRKAAEGRTNRLGRAHPSTLNALTNLSMVLASQANKFDEGETLAREVLSLRQKKLGEYHTSTLVSVVNLMRILLEGRDTYGRAYGSEIKELQAKLGEALDKGVWGADILDSELGTTRLDGDLGVLPVFRTSRFGPKEWIRSHIPDWSKRHKQPTHSRLPTTYERVDLRTYLSALQQTQ
jgi:tetratricopeptide (TPR) repeat protein